MAKKSTANVPQGTRIYIGKSISGLSQYTVFEPGQLPAYVQEMGKKYPSLLKLIVPISGLQQARVDVQTKGHVLNMYWNQLLKEGN